MAGSEAEATDAAAVSGGRDGGACVTASVDGGAASCGAEKDASVQTGEPPVTRAPAATAVSGAALALPTPILLGLAARRGADLLAEALAPLRLHPRHYGILLALAEGGPSSQSALGERLGIDRTTMVTAVDHLEDVGCLARQPDPADRRANRVELTGRGRGRLVRATGAVDAAERRLLADLSANEVAILRSLLARLRP